MSDEHFSSVICQLVDYAARCGLIADVDRVWSYNAILEAIGATGPAPQGDWVLNASTESACIADPAFDAASFDLEATLGILSDAAVAAGIAEDTATGRDRIAMRIMGVLTPRPSDVIGAFKEIRSKDGVRAATDWFYQLCCNAGYVRRAAIARNIAWQTATRWGSLEITINRSKPEKDPRDIAAAGAAKNSGEVYPSCQLCIENEGYPGRSTADAGGHPARQNLRIIPLELGGERWGVQYSPYAYYNEHCIVMSSHHRPMHIDAPTLNCLLDFVDTIPHYFIGSNADLPIVGGSILSHDHFQGGAHEFPMMQACVEDTFTLEKWPQVTGEVLTWPLSVLRLRSNNRADIAAAADHIITAWRSWSDTSVGVVARTEDGVFHNTVTPIVRRVDQTGAPGGDMYEVYLALRCNITSDEHPLGIFHPHAEYHHIKKENIGLIEVMGLAILPARLVDELDAVRKHLLSCSTEEELVHALENDPLTASHATWAHAIAIAHPDLNEQNATDILYEEVGTVFGHVLEDAGVFKHDEAGRSALKRFIASL